MKTEILNNDTLEITKYILAGDYLRDEERRILRWTKSLITEKGGVCGIDYLIENLEQLIYDAIAFHNFGEQKENSKTLMLSVLISLINHYSTN